MGEKNIKIRYDEEADVLFVMWGKGPIWESEYDWKRQLVWHYNSMGVCIGAELLMFSKIKEKFVVALKEVLSFCEDIG